MARASGERSPSIVGSKPTPLRQPPDGRVDTTQPCEGCDTGSIPVRETVQSQVTCTSRAECMGPARDCITTPVSETDIMRGFEPRDAGSTPARGTARTFARNGSIVQWIGQAALNRPIRVRLPMDPHRSVGPRQEGKRAERRPEGTPDARQQGAEGCTPVS